MLPRVTSGTGIPSFLSIDPLSISISPSALSIPPPKSSPRLIFGQFNVFVLLEVPGGKWDDLRVCVVVWGGVEWSGVEWVREMNISHASVHPVEDPRTVEAADVPRLRMKDFQGMPATLGGLALRLFQFLFSVFALCIMATTSDFPSVTAFRYLVAATGLQCLWSFSLAMTDIYALLARRSLQNCRLVTLFAVCDGITSTLTFSAACASAGITVLIDNDLGNCSWNHCTQFEASTAMAFASWFVALPSFLFNYWSLATR